MYYAVQTFNHTTTTTSERTLKHTNYLLQTAAVANATPFTNVTITVYCITCSLIISRRLIQTNTTRDTRH